MDNELNIEECSNNCSSISYFENIETLDDLDILKLEDVSQFAKNKIKEDTKNFLKENGISIEKVIYQLESLINQERDDLISEEYDEEDLNFPFDNALWLMDILKELKVELNEEA